MLTTLQDVLKEYKSDMERMEHRIHESLGTDVPLIQQVSKYILGAGGKRFRPLLLFLSSRLCGYREHNTEYTLGSVVEYIHTASLLHDDVVDEAKISDAADHRPTRYGETRRASSLETTSIPKPSTTRYGSRTSV